MLNTGITVPILLLVLRPSAAKRRLILLPFACTASWTCGINRSCCRMSFMLRQAPSPFLAWITKCQLIYYKNIYIYLLYRHFCYSLHAFVKHCSYHSKITFISSCRCDILYNYIYLLYTSSTYNVCQYTTHLFTVLR